MMHVSVRCRQFQSTLIRCYLIVDMKIEKRIQIVKQNEILAIAMSVDVLLIYIFIYRVCVFMILIQR